MISNNKNKSQKLSINDIVYHPRFGDGIVETINDEETTIAFGQDKHVFKVSNTLNKYFYKYDENGVCIFNDELIKCRPLKKEIIVDVNKINECAFANNNVIEKIYLRNVQIIDCMAFSNCSNLNSVTLSTIKTINSKAFAGCSRLNEIFIPKSIKSISNDAFDKDVIIVCKSPEINEILLAVGYKNVYYDKNNKRTKAANKELKKEDSEISKLIVNDLTKENKINRNKKIKPIIIVAVFILSFFLLFKENISNVIELKNNGFIQLKNGSYSGELSFGNISGNGIFTFNSGDYFEGLFDNGEAISGSYYSLDGNNEVKIDYEDKNPISYAVKLTDENGNFNGSGYAKNVDETNEYYVVYSNGDSYYGEIKSGKRNGSGIYTFSNGNKYTGEWYDDIPNGNGEFSNNLINYSGLFIDGKAEEGNITFDYNSNNYSISVNEGEIETEVKIVNSNFTYLGDYNADGKISGKCKISFSNGDKYDGKISEGLLSGYGTYTWNNSEKYEGYFSEGKMNGNGTYYFGSTQRLSGYFYNNKPSGTCYYYTSDGTRYVTYWSNGSMTNIYQG